MRIVIQRVLEAKVEVDGKCVGSIGKGFLIFLGVGQNDTRQTADRYIDKILKLRICADENGKTNLSLKDVGGEILIVSQFTLYADCRKGNRPDFLKAADPETAKDIYEYFIEQIKGILGRAESGRFGASMKVSLVNDGPFTVILDEDLIQNR
jgi:D-tyrosyl-tRNA(Tyr) deacylase